MAKPTGWWTTHPTILNVTVAGAWDSNGDGIGDFEGIRQHLDYLIDMGISGIRFQQVTRFDDDFEWFGLVAQDWFDVDPLYGTLEDFDRLVADCRKKDFKLLVMAVPEYTGWHHPDYLAARKAHDEGLDDPRVDWFQWEDDGTVSTVWNRPGPDLANPAFMDAYLEHVGFWMDRGIDGWDVDAPHTWLNLNLEAVQRLTAFVKERGGLITSECLALEHDIIRQGEFNAGTGRGRTALYNETKAILESDASYIRQGVETRRQLIDHGMFPYQQFGDQMFKQYTGKNWLHKLPMWRLQVAFNAALPDQIWAFGNSIAFPTKPISPNLPQLDCICWNHLDLAEINRQDGDPDSPFEFLKRVFKLRANAKALGIGDIEELPTNARHTVFAALRKSEDETERAITVFNFSDKPCDVTLLTGNRIESAENYVSDEVVSSSGGTLSVHLGTFGFKYLKVVE